MSTANIKISSQTLKQLKEITGEKTGQKAIQKALEFLFNAAKQRNIIELLRRIEFQKGFNPLKLRRRDR